MTIAKKLWLGHGILILILIVTALTVGTSMSTVERDLEELTKVEEPANRAARTMSASVTEMGITVLNYLTTADPKYRDQAMAGAAKFDQARMRYGELTGITKGKELGSELDRAYQEYKALGDALMSTRDDQEAIYAEIAGHFEKIYGMVHEKMEAESKEDTRKALKEIDLWLEQHLEPPFSDLKGYLFEDTKNFQDILARLKSLYPAESDQDWIRASEDLLKQIWSSVQEVGSLENGLRENMKKFLELRSRVSYILENEILILARRNLETAKEEAHRAVRNTRIVILVVLLVGLVAGTAAAMSLSREIMRSVHELVGGTRKIGQGALGHRIRVETEDEMGELAAAFNRMSDELEQAAIQHERIEAEKLALVKGMSDGAAHEVKNLIAILQQGAEYLSKKINASDPNASSVLQEMNEAIRRAKYVLEGLSEVANLSTANFDAASAEIAPLLDQALLLVKHQCDESHVEIIKDIEANLPLVKVGKTRMEQVFLNLFLNAVQAMKPKGGELKIKAYTKKLEEVGPKTGRRREDTFQLGQTAVVVEIEDTGPGIPEDVLAKVFNPFFTTRRSSGGTGLGLSVVKSILEMHQGAIEIANREGGGVRVTVMLRI